MGFGYGSAWVSLLDRVMNVCIFVAAAKGISLPRETLAHGIFVRPALIQPRDNFPHFFNDQHASRRQPSASCSCSPIAARARHMHTQGCCSPGSDRGEKEKCFTCQEKPTPPRHLRSLGRITWETGENPLSTPQKHLNNNQPFFRPPSLSPPPPCPPLPA